MITQGTLAAAVGRGILSAEQAEALRALAAEIEAPEPVDEERLRLVTGFGDIFVTLGISLFVVAVGYFALQAGGLVGLWGTLAVTAWALAEFFTRVRRMALPSLNLLCLFAVSVFGTVNLLLLPAEGAEGPYLGPLGRLGVDMRHPGLLTIGALATAALVALHYRRFRVPITVAAGTAALAAAGFGGLAALAPAFTRAWLVPIVLGMGLVIFALAMRFDLSDPRRETRRTDVAFWLHLLAAPLIVHPLVAGILAGDGIDRAGALGVLGVFLALALVAVVVDRRAVLVSGLAYAGYAFATLIGESGFADHGIPLTLLALGAFVLLLSAGWRPLRRGLLRLLPVSVAGRLPHPLASA